jgi:hypothetical protein
VREAVSEWISGVDNKRVTGFDKMIPDNIVGDVDGVK